MHVSAGQVWNMWCPVLYRVAVHHVATFITEQPDTSIAQQLSARIEQLGNKVNSAVHIQVAYNTRERLYLCFHYVNKFGGGGEINGIQFVYK
jgi:hypothetical protein